MDIDMSNVEEFQLELELSENDPPREKSVDNKDEIMKKSLKLLVLQHVPVEYPSTSPEGVATIFHIADWTDSNHTWKNRVKGDINEFEINTYDEKYKLGWEFLGDGQAKGLGLALYELDSSKDWGTHLMHIFKSCVVHFQNLFNKHFSQETYNLAKSILNAPSQESIESILNAIESLDESGAKDWAKYYKTP
ncbi:unnamed protein product [Rhizophagus irregularis]|uniref:Uncharacterized protein n=1 Tax=Rhizophagus irregularis TaxID=588596 RepID=A0A2I1GM40_9GLOM|nr:hypothetical protein RhiirA4_463043 [Rhizophagus irregularis]CAB4404792.1 unnamed protein product [Rhizophagus irregularis]